MSIISVHEWIPGGPVLRNNEKILATEEEGEDNKSDKHNKQNVLRAPNSLVQVLTKGEFMALGGDSYADAFYLSHRNDSISAQVNPSRNLLVD